MEPEYWSCMREGSEKCILMHLERRTDREGQIADRTKWASKECTQ